MFLAGALAGGAVIGAMMWWALYRQSMDVEAWRETSHFWRDQYDKERWARQQDRKVDDVDR